MLRTLFSMGNNLSHKQKIKAMNNTQATKFKRLNNIILKLQSKIV